MRVKTDVSKGVKKTGKKSQKKATGKLSGGEKVARKKKPKPRKTGKPVGKSNLKTPLNAATDNVLGEKSSERFDSPRESDQSSYLSEICGAEPKIVDEKISHYGYGDLKEQPETEVTEEHVPVLVEVGESTLINWEHFSLVYEEYCLTKEVNKGV